MNVTRRAAVVGLICLGSAIPADGQTRFGDVRLIADATEESADLERAVLVSDAQARRLRIEDRDGTVRLETSFDQLRSLHFEESTYPPRLFARSAAYLTIHYLRGPGDTAVAAVRLPSESVARVLETLERDSGLRVDRSATAASFLGLPLHLTPKYPVEVRDSTGRKTRGQVSALSDTMIELGTAGRFEAGSISRIDVIDPIRNGAARGATLGILLGLVFWATIPECEDLCGLLPSLAGGVAIGAVSGALIDANTRRSAFRRPEPGVRVSLRF